ncbi:hypothetical protein CALCODRAFT_509814 [Calocera cornea HHB12733]|uniref:DUF6532 domain-containing protein n=1 Tax=Calocera cornea HHB12733 TaxID=1353952 RepID=A0A165EZ96_9BASI|nr:hypothetical protein CALCODRAFT_509814 [Calocera cornea HHB12733]
MAPLAVSGSTNHMSPPGLVSSGTEKLNLAESSCEGLISPQTSTPSTLLSSHVSTEQQLSISSVYAQESRLSPDSSTATSRPSPQALSMINIAGLLTPITPARAETSQTSRSAPHLCIPLHETDVKPKTVYEEGDCYEVSSSQGYEKSPTPSPPMPVHVPPTEEELQPRISGLPLIIQQRFRHLLLLLRVEFLSTFAFPVSIVVEHILEDFRQKVNKAPQYPPDSPQLDFQEYPELKQMALLAGAVMRRDLLKVAEAVIPKYWPEVFSLVDEEKSLSRTPLQRRSDRTIFVNAISNLLSNSNFLYYGYDPLYPDIPAAGCAFQSTILVDVLSTFAFKPKGAYSMAAKQPDKFSPISIAALSLAAIQIHQVLLNWATGAYSPHTYPTVIRDLGLYKSYYIMLKSLAATDKPKYDALIQKMTAECYPPTNAKLLFAASAAQRWRPQHALKLVIVPKPYADRETCEKGQVAAAYGVEEEWRGTIHHRTMKTTWALLEACLARLQLQWVHVPQQAGPAVGPFRISRIITIRKLSVGKAPPGAILPSASYSTRDMRITSEALLGREWPNLGARFGLLPKRSYWNAIVFRYRKVRQRLQLKSSAFYQEGSFYVRTMISRLTAIRVWFKNRDSEGVAFHDRCELTQMQIHCSLDQWSTGTKASALTHQFSADAWSKTYFKHLENIETFAAAFPAKYKKIMKHMFVDALVASGVQQVTTEEEPNYVDAFIARLRNDSPDHTQPISDESARGWGNPAHWDDNSQGELGSMNINQVVEDPSVQDIRQNGRIFDNAQRGRLTSNAVEQTKDMERKMLSTSLYKSSAPNATSSREGMDPIATTDKHQWRHMRLPSLRISAIGSPSSADTPPFSQELLTRSVSDSDPILTPVSIPLCTQDVPNAPIASLDPPTFEVPNSDITLDKEVGRVHIDTVTTGGQQPLKLFFGGTTSEDGDILRYQGLMTPCGSPVVSKVLATPSSVHDSNVLDTALETPKDRTVQQPNTADEDRTCAFNIHPLGSSTPATLQVAFVATGLPTSESDETTSLPIEETFPDLAISTPQSMGRVLRSVAEESGSAGPSQQCSNTAGDPNLPILRSTRSNRIVRPPRRFAQSPERTINRRKAGSRKQ